MFDLILNAILFYALLLFAVSLEGCLPAAIFCRRYASCTSIMSRYLIVALAAFPWITFAKFKAGERALQRAGTNLVFSSGVLTGRAYISEILISAVVSIVFVGSFATWSFARRLVSRVVNGTASKP